MSALTDIGQLVYFFLAAGVANMAPVLFQYHFISLARPVDGGHMWRGERVFGDHKTWRGLFVAVVIGGLFYLLQYLVAQWYAPAQHWSYFSMLDAPWWFGFLLSAGAISGDLIKSFFKRRVHVDPGHSWFPFDQLDFLLGAALVTLFFFDIPLFAWVVIIALGTILHVLVNHLGYWLGIKDHKW